MANCGPWEGLPLRASDFRFQIPSPVVGDVCGPGVPSA